MKFPFQRYIVCWGKIYGSKIIGEGGPPRATSAFYSVKLCNLIAKNNCLDVINWSDHLRVIKVIKFTKAKNPRLVKVKEKNTTGMFSKIFSMIIDANNIL